MAYINLFPTYANNRQLGTEGDGVTAYREHLRLYIEQVKPSLISYDHYQFKLKADGDQYFLNLAMIRRAAQEAGVPFLNIVQACTWAPEAVLRIDSAPSAASPRGFLLGFFGTMERLTHAVVVNLDYAAEGKASLAGPGELDLFDATTARWTPANKTAFELILPPGGGRLVRITR